MGKTDPVCGQTIDPLRARAVSIVAGQKYYFCSVEHRNLFAEDPGKFIPSIAPEIPLEEQATVLEIVAELPPTEPTPTALTISAGVPLDPTPAPVDSGPIRPPTAKLLRFEIGGMEGPEDAERVRRAMTRIPGVSFVEIDLVTEVAAVGVDEPIKAATIIEAVSAAGYEASPRQASARDDLAALAIQASNLLIRAGVTMACALILFVAGGFARGALGWAVLVVAALVALIAGSPMARDLTSRLRHRVVGTELLSAVAAVTFLGLAISRVLDSGDARLSGASVAVMAFALAGRWCEESARHAAGTEIAQLEGALPTHARRVRAGKPSVEVPVGELVPGDLVRVSTGEPIPVDGVVRTGEGNIDESLVSNRTAPVTRVPGDSVVGGTLLTSGTLIIEVRRAGRETVVSRLRAAVVEAQGSSSAITRFAERAELWTGPVAIGLALFVLAVQLVRDLGFGQALCAAATVLVVVCPLAVGLATPTALAIATARAARRGILFRNAEALQRAHAITTVVVDKNATLTQNRRRAIAHAVVPDGDSGRLIALAAAAERTMEAPLARAICTYAEAEGILIPPLDKGVGVVGMGVTASVAGVAVAVGSRRLMERECSADQGDLDELERMLREKPVKSVVYVALDGRLAGALGIEESIRTGAGRFVTALHDAGLRVALVTGDGQTIAAQVATETGISDVQADLRPDEKKSAIVKLRDTWGGAVAAVGDGIDDAQALAAADLGIALGRSVDLALEAGAVTVLRGDLAGVVAALAMARRAIGIMRQNLWGAFVWGAAATLVLALAPLGDLAPFVGVAGALVVVWGVVRNSLRLGREADSAETSSDPTVFG